jgi:hypothetical protein
VDRGSLWGDLIVVPPALVRVLPAIAFLAASLSACGTGAESSNDPAAARTERCVDRLLEHALRDGTSEEGLRRYARDTYCARFEREGWVYDDGALSIEAHRWLVEGGTCSTQTPGEPAETAPCEPIDPQRLECALLRHVRRSEVVAYLEHLGREGAVECDDGTPLDQLGVP